MGPGHTVWLARGIHFGMRACRCLVPCGPAAGAHGYSVLGVPWSHTFLHRLAAALFPVALCHSVLGVPCCLLCFRSLWVPSMVGCRSSPGLRVLPHAQGVRFSRLVIRLLGRSDLQPEVVAWVWEVSCCFFLWRFGPHVEGTF